MKKIILLLLVSMEARAGIREDIYEVMRLREEVEVLSFDVEALKKNHQFEVDVYLSREQEIQANLLKEKFKTEQLRRQILMGKDKILRMSARSTSRESQNFQRLFWDKYDQSLDKAIPTISKKLRDRLGKLKLDFDAKKISYEHSLLQTWYILEEDLKSSRDADYVIAPITLDKKTHHLELVRLGRNLAYFRSAEGDYGQLLTEPSLKMQKYTDQKSKQMIDLLLSQFKQNSKTGLYSLPGIRL